MKRYEKESFKKSFLLFFTIQLLFLTLVMWQYQKSVVHKYDMKIMNEMTQCSYTLDCSKLTMDFVNDLKGYSTNAFYERDDYFMLFSLSEDTEYYLKLSLDREDYQKVYFEILYDIGIKYFLYLLILILISLFFARFSLRPLREALALNDEFVKDMLHDFNTPLSSLKINFKILQKKFGEDDAILRSEQAMQNIQNLQSNLSAFLSHNPLTIEAFDVALIIEKCIKDYQHIFSDITFENQLKPLMIKSNLNAFTRIIDNILSNAGKYNKPNGWVKIYLLNQELVIEDSGIGIKNPSRVFDRFYKETSRGMGIGLHVVQKLCLELNMTIKVRSEVGKGTALCINLEKLTLD